jgi:hypothetical protein
MLFAAGMRMASPHNARQFGSSLFSSPTFGKRLDLWHGEKASWIRTRISFLQGSLIRTTASFTERAVCAFLDRRP